MTGLGSLTSIGLFLLGMSVGWLVALSLSFMKVRRTAEENFPFIVRRISAQLILFPDGNGVIQKEIELKPRFGGILGWTGEIGEPQYMQKTSAELEGESLDVEVTHDSQYRILFSHPPRRGQYSTLSVKHELGNAFPETTEFWINVLRYPVRLVELKIIFSQERPPKSVIYTLKHGGFAHEVKRLESKDGGNEYRVLARDLIAGSALEFTWSW